VAKIVHGIDLDAVKTTKKGMRLWTPEQRAKIVGLMEKIPPVQLGKDLQIHPVQLYAWRAGRAKSPRTKTSTKRATRKGGLRKGQTKESVRAKKIRPSIISTVLPDTAALIEGLRTKRDRLLEAAATFGKTIAALENGGIPTDTVKLSDAMVPTTKRLSAKGRAAISKAAKKRWATYHRNKRKK